jgi:hypothetical protein
LQKELETTNARRKIEQEHFEEERYDFNRQIERLQNENEGLLSNENFKEEVRVGEENDKQQRELIVRYKFHKTDIIIAVFFPC